MVTVALIWFGDTITAKRMVFCITITISFVVIMQKFQGKYNCNRWKEEVIDELVYRALIMRLKTVCELKTQLKRFNGEYFETFQNI